MNLSSDELTLLIDVYAMSLQRKKQNGQTITPLEDVLYWKLMSQASNTLIPQISVQLRKHESR